MSKQMTKTTNFQQVEHGDERAELAQRALALETLARDLLQRLARGTRPIPVVAATPRATALMGKDVAKAIEPTRDLYERVAGALEKPMPFRELMFTLGPDVNENRVKGILVRLQRDGRGLVNLGNGSRAIWWIDTRGRLAEIAANASKRILSAKR